MGTSPTIVLASPPSPMAVTAGAFRFMARPRDVLRDLLCPFPRLPLADVASVAGLAFDCLPKSLLAPSGGDAELPSVDSNRRLMKLGETHRSSDSRCDTLDPTGGTNFARRLLGTLFSVSAGASILGTGSRDGAFGGPFTLGSGAVPDAGCFRPTSDSLILGPSLERAVCTRCSTTAR